MPRRTCVPNSEAADGRPVSGGGGGILSSSSSDPSSPPDNPSVAVIWRRNDTGAMWIWNPDTLNWDPFVV